jgi:hypothetical protein
MTKLKPLFPFLLLLLVSAVVILNLFPGSHPQGALVLPLDSDSVIQRSRELIAELSLDVTGYSPDAQLRMNRPLIRQSQRELGIERSNVRLRDSLPGYTWRVRWSPRTGFGQLFREGNGNEEERVRDAVRRMKGELVFNFDTRGTLIGFSRVVADSAKIASVSAEEAKQLAVEFMDRFAGNKQWSGEDTVRVPPLDQGSIQYSVRMSGTEVESEKKIEQPHRTDFEYVWAARSTEPDNKILIRVGIAGDAVSRYAVEYQIPEQYKQTDTMGVHQVVVVLLYFGLAVLMIVLTFKRIRSYEIGFKFGMIIGIGGGVLMALQLYLTLYREMGWEIILPVFFAPLFIGGALIVLWAVSEAIGRDAWKEKFISIDLLFKGSAFHSRVGMSVIRGLALGVGSFAVWLLLFRGGSMVLNLWMGLPGEDADRMFDSFSPSFHVLGASFINVMYVFTFFVLFAVSFLRKKISSLPAIVAIGTVVLGLGFGENVQPLSAGIAIQLGMAAIVVWSFVRYDVLTSFLALWMFTITKETATLLFTGNPAYMGSAFMLLGLLVVMILISLLTLYRKNEITDFDSITPAFARHISERQRLQQELEIARQVQMSFLPKTNPKFGGLDIASRCAPALEVGGDYYDFMELGDRKLGVAVGDVSGKGTQAAFFMTLTKGFLRALAGVTDSPASILTRINKLFYENVERGIFISMVYGIFDTGKNNLRFARAGHNPVLTRKHGESRVRILNPMGLALGLDEGEKFSMSIQEMDIPFQPGDLFVFYTDGLPEGMNKAMEEFGEERLLKAVEKYAHGPAAEILEGVFSEMKHFTGKAKQHDDMTIVVVKVI